MKPFFVFCIVGVYAAALTSAAPVLPAARGRFQLSMTPALLTL
jgi:hypothetical protein